jgi:hypothetical protein
VATGFVLRAGGLVSGWAPPNPGHGETHDAIDAYNFHRAWQSNEYAGKQWINGGMA